jgi:hypothetical protein
MGWIISVTTERLGGGQPLVQYYAVRIADQQKAIATLCEALGTTSDEVVRAEMPKPDRYFDFLEIGEGKARTLPVLGSG